MPAVGGDRRRRPARRALAGDRRRRALPAARQHPRVRARGDGRGGATGAPSTRTRRGTRAAAARPPPACAARARPSTWRSRAPSARTSTPRWPGARRTTRRARCAIANGFGWAWIVLGDHRGAQRLLAALDAAGEAAPASDRASALLLAAWIEASTGHLEPARRHVASAARAGRRTRTSGALRLLPRLRRLPPRRVGARAGAHRPQRAPTAGATAVGPGRERAVRRARRDLGRRPRARRRAPATRSSAGCARSTTRGCTSAATRCSASWRGSSTASTTPSRHIGRAAETSGRLGFLQTEAYQITSLGRAQCQAGDYEAGAATLELGIAKAEATGDVRLAALAPRAPRARAAGARPDRDGARGARGGRAPGTARPAAASRRALGDVPAGGARRRRRPERRARLEALLDAARRDGDAPVEVFALDALGRSRRGRPRGWRPPSHFITERDRTDRPLVQHHERQQAAHDDRDPERLPAVDDLAEQQVRPHDRERRLRDLGDRRSCRSGSSSARRRAAPGRRPRW